LKEEQQTFLAAATKSNFFFRSRNPDDFAVIQSHPTGDATDDPQFEVPWGYQQLEVPLGY